jgi:hypothetical protein
MEEFTVASKIVEIRNQVETIISFWLQKNPKNQFLDLDSIILVYGNRGFKGRINLMAG